jgi:glycosyltransferase involved in cell wall biosynthesis
MRHLLCVAYYFPPMGGVPVRRILRFVRHLPAQGWRCTVLTADRPWDPHHPLDPEGLDAIPAGTRLLRSPAHPGLERALAAGLRAWQRRPRRRRPAGAQAPASAAVGGAPRRWLHESLAFPDPKHPWIRGAVRVAEDALRRDPCDAILATGYPWSCFVAADRLGTRLGLPVVLDYRDAWTLSPRELWNGPRNRALEARIVGRAAALTTVTEWISEAMRRRFGRGEEDVVTLPNGFDPEEYPQPDPALRHPGRLEVVYTGTFNDALPPSPFDRTPFHLIRAVTKLPADVRRALRIRLVGPLGPNYRRLIEEEGVGDVLRWEGAVSHRRALQYQVSADVLLLVIYDCPGAAGDMTGKLVEYAGAGRPVLALAPEGEASRFVRDHGLGWVVPPTDVEAIAERLAELARQPRAGRPPPGEPASSGLSAAAQAERLAALLERCQKGDRARPGLEVYASTH